MALFKQGKAILLHPITRGMVAYSVLWPTGSIIQQTLAGQKWGKCQHALVIVLYDAMLRPFFFRNVRLDKVHSIQCVWSAVCSAYAICMGSFCRPNLATKRSAYGCDKSPSRTGDIRAISISYFFLCYDLYGNTKHCTGPKRGGRQVFANL